MKRFWKIFRIIYPFVVLALLYVIWKDVLPLYRFLTKPMSSASETTEPAAPQNEVSTQSLLESSPSALPAIKEAVEKVAPNNAKAFVGLGLLYESKGKSDEALTYFRRAVELDPLSADAQFRLGYAYWSKQQATEARLCYEKAIAAKPDYIPAYYGLGLIHQEAGRLIEAQQTYEKVLSIKKDEYQAINNLAIVFENIGDEARALGCYEEAVRLKPDNPVISENLSEAKKAYGDLTSKPCFEEKNLPSIPRAVVRSAPSAPSPPKRARDPGAQREMRLKNGHTLVGEITEETDQGYWFESGDGAGVYINKNEIAELN